MSIIQKIWQGEVSKWACYIRVMGKKIFSGEAILEPRKYTYGKSFEGPVQKTRSKSKLNMLEKYRTKPVSYRYEQAGE